MYSLSILLFILLPLVVHSASVCDPKVEQINWPAEAISTNTKLEGGISEFKPINASSLNECVLLCCQDKECNFAYYKESRFCNLITCNEPVCVPVSNERKTKNDQIDFLVQVKDHQSNEQQTDSEEIFEKLLEREKNFIQEIESAIQCKPNSLKSDCEVNEVCLVNKVKNIYECVCPKEKNMHRIQGVCREYLANSEECTFFIDECRGVNEECVAKSTRAKHGTCQCKIGFLRNLRTLECEPILAGLTTPNQVTNNRRRPAPPSSQAETAEPKKDESLWQQILEELGVKTTTPTLATESQISSDMSTINVSKTSLNSKTKNLSTRTETTTTTTTTTKSTTTVSILTEPQHIITTELNANAGPDIHVYYPSRMCILNGSLTSFIRKSPLDVITKWEWTKQDTSPAFGHFVNTNEGPIVIYENLIEGEYKFLLKVWTSNGQFSQDTVHVYVHSNLNTNFSRNLPIIQKNQKLDIPNLNENIIQIELDINPSLFNEFLKQQFLTKLEILLQQHQAEFKLKEPKAILLNTRISTSTNKKSTVMLELIITDILDLKQGTIDLNLSRIDNVYSQNQDLIGENRQIISSANLVKLLRKKQKTFKTLLDSVHTFIQRIQSANDLINAQFLKLDQKSVLDFLNIKILSISQSTCIDDSLFLNATLRKYACSNHGKCDLYSHKCVCNRFWMPNFYLYYIDQESDLTNGNNCEHNVILVALVALTIVLTVFIITRVVCKYFLYYLFCCCCCCGKKTLKSKSKRGRYSRALKDDSYLNDSNDNLYEEEEEEDDEEKYAKSFISRSKQGLLNKLRKVPGSNSKPKHKYALLQNEESESMNSSKSGKSRFFKNNGITEDIQMGAQLTYNEDEDVVYEESMIKNSKDDSPSIKKYNLI